MCRMPSRKGQYFQPAKNGGECWTLQGRCMEGAMGPMAVWEQQVGRPVPAGFRIKRTHPNRRREFPWGIPRPYAWPQPTFLGAAVDNTRVEWEQWVKQALSTLLA